MPDDAPPPRGRAPVPATADGGTPSFGIDAPPLMLGLVALGALAAFVAAFSAGGGNQLAAIGPGIAAVLFLGTAGYGLYGSTRGKPALWDAALDDLALRGDEDALDLGCGRGLVLLGLARRLPDGHVTGIDLWRSRDQSGNSRATTETNVAVVGVADRVDVVDGDMVELPFEDATFDVVTAGFAIHNIPLPADRRRAVTELVRVLRPGGRVVILDIAKTAEYVEGLTSAGLADVARSRRRWATYPPSRLVTATKAGRRRR